MKRFGYILIVVGVGLMGAALVMDVTVAAPGIAFADPALQSGRIANWDLIGKRQVLATVGTGIFVGGWISLVVALLREGRSPPAA